MSGPSVPIGVVGYFEFPQAWNPSAPCAILGLMPKRLSRDVNQAAFQMVRRSTGTETAPNVSASDISRVMAAMGSKGGKIGGKRRLQTMTRAERSAVAAKAAKTRWAKHKKDEI
jgi:hypothetical protein